MRFRGASPSRALVPPRWDGVRELRGGVLTLVVAAALIAGILRSQFLVRAGRLGSAAAAVGRAFPITSEYVPFYS